MIFVNTDQEKYVSCIKCKNLLVYLSLNGTNNLRTDDSSCLKLDKPSFLFQKTVYDFYSFQRTI